MKKLVVLVILTIMALNVQWHYDRVCATVFSPRAYFKLDGVYCETGLEGFEFKLDELLARHKRVQEQIECMAAKPEKKFLCDPRWIPASNEGDA